MEHIIALKFDVKPMRGPMQRPTPTKKEVGKQAIQKLIRLKDLETSVSPGATNNVFVQKEDGGFRETSNIRKLNDLTMTDSYQTENMRDISDWLRSKQMFSTLDLKDGFFRWSCIQHQKNARRYGQCLEFCSTGVSYKVSRVLRAYFNVLSIISWVMATV